jgi:hypothetical protein
MNAILLYDRTIQKYNEVIIACLFVCLLWMAFIPKNCIAAELVSGQTIPVGGPDRRGPLTVGVVSAVVGSAFISNPEGADIFVASNRHSAVHGLFLFPYLEKENNGAPVFGKPKIIPYPAKDKLPPSGTIFQTLNGTIYGYWLKDTTIVRTIFDKDLLTFVDNDMPPILVSSLPRAPRNLAVDLKGQKAQLIFGLSDGTSYRPEGVGGRSPDYRPYNGAGVWRGDWPFMSLYSAEIKTIGARFAHAHQASITQQESLMDYGNLTFVNLGPDREHDVIAGSRFGNLLYYHQKDRFEKHRLAVGYDNIALRHPTILPMPIVWPRPKSGMSDLIVSGEGALYFYQFTGSFTANGAPIFKNAIPVKQQNAALYDGSLPVINVVDLDDDGADDIVSGNSQGRVVFFENVGNNLNPDFMPAVNLKAQGFDIHIQQGYGGIQGPGESRWGYVCPTVYDWNSDGLLDILLSGAHANHLVYINQGTAAHPIFARPSPLYLQGLDLHGTWRVQPGVAQLDDRLAYVILDDDDQFHLYWRLDDFNVTDGGKLRLTDGTPISANFIFAGGSGRIKIVLDDWDNDGFVDIIAGTPRHGSIPNPKTGLPQSLGLPGAAVLFLKNVGSNKTPIFEFPKLFAFKGDPIFLGQHACSPAIANFGKSDGKDLVVGSQDGQFIFYERSDLSLISPAIE